jgi:UPF0755 protein
VTATLDEETRVARSRRTAIVIVVLVILPLIVLASGALWFWFQLDPPGGAGKKMEVQIERGWGVPRIGDELEKRGVISSSLVFSVYARLNGDTKFEAGTYVLRKHMGVRDAIKVLKAKPRLDYTMLTIPPGMWLKDIAARVGKLPGRNAEDFEDAAVNNAVRSTFEPEGVQSLEGLLWPDTYKIAAEDDEIDILNQMATTFQKKVEGLGISNSNANAQGRSAYDIIKVASLIEAEAKVDADRPLIASVIYNRLAQNMPLQIDATLIYARNDPNNRSLTNADKQIDSPYNTYLHTGLPPTPIAAVSAASIKAALNPAQTDYLYYVVAGKDGHHAFASTLEQHQRNIDAARAAGVLP